MARSFKQKVETVPVQQRPCGTENCHHTYAQQEPSQGKPGGHEVESPIGMLRGKSPLKQPRNTRQCTCQRTAETAMKQKFHPGRPIARWLANAIVAWP